MAGNLLTTYRTARSAFPAVVLDLTGLFRQSGKIGGEWRDSRLGTVSSPKVSNACLAHVAEAPVLRTASAVQNLSGRGAGILQARDGNVTRRWAAAATRLDGREHPHRRPDLYAPAPSRRARKPFLGRCGGTQHHRGRGRPHPKALRTPPPRTPTTRRRQTRSALLAVEPRQGSAALKWPESPLEWRESRPPMRRSDPLECDRKGLVDPSSRLPARPLRRAAGFRAPALQCVWRSGSVLSQSHRSSETRYIRIQV